MGTLTPPASGTVYVDTQVVIYSVEKHPDYWQLVRPLWLAAQTGSIKIVSSELTLLETLVAPLRNSDAPLAAAYEQLLLATGVRLIPITASILKDAARLRPLFNERPRFSMHQ